MPNSLDALCVTTKRVIVKKFKLDQVCLVNHKSVFSLSLSLKKAI